MAQRAWQHNTAHSPPGLHPMCRAARTARHPDPTATARSCSSLPLYKVASPHAHHVGKVLAWQQLRAIHGAALHQPENKCTRAAQVCKLQAVPQLAQDTAQRSAAVLRLPQLVKSAAAPSLARVKASSPHAALYKVHCQAVPTCRVHARSPHAYASPVQLSFGVAGRQHRRQLLCIHRAVPVGVCLRKQLRGFGRPQVCPHGLHTKGGMRACSHGKPACSLRHGSGARSSDLIGGWWGRMPACDYTPAVPPPTYADQGVGLRAPPPPPPPRPNSLHASRPAPSMHCPPILASSRASNSSPVKLPSPLRSARRRGQQPRGGVEGASSDCPR